MIRNFLFTLLLCTAAPYLDYAQLKSGPDKNYLDDRSNDLVMRVYGSNKFSRLTLGDVHYKEKLSYRSNTNYNTGVGFNYRWLTVNIGFNTPGINKDDDRYGKSEWLDFQSYVYLRKMTIDFYAQSYEGYYLHDGDLLSREPAGQPAYIRNDIQTRKLGANVEYLFNGDRFSYRSVFLQNERQLKSAGSFIVGAGLHYDHTRADSSLIPDNLKYAFFNGNEDYNHSGIASFTINGGYAHTFVIAKNFFLTGSLQAGIGANYSILKNDATDYKDGRVGLQLNGITRLGAGYNGNRYYAGIYYVTNIESSILSNGGGYQQYETGMLRVAVARRLTAPKKMARLFDGIEGIFK